MSSLLGSGYCLSFGGVFLKRLACVFEFFLPVAFFNIWCRYWYSMVLDWHGCWKICTRSWMILSCTWVAWLSHGYQLAVAMVGIFLPSNEIMCWCFCWDTLFFHLCFFHLYYGGNGPNPEVCWELLVLSWDAGAWGMLVFSSPHGVYHL